MLFASNQSTSRSQSLRTISIYAAEPCRSFSLAWLCVLMLAGFAWPTALLPTVLLPSARAADLDEARALFDKGEYDACIEMTKAEVERGIWHDGWSKLLMRSLMVKGQYAEAAEVYTKVAEKFSASLSLRMLAAEALRFSGKHAEARALIAQIPALIQAAPWRFTDRDNMVTLGNYELSEGLDPRIALRTYFDPTLKSDAKFVDAHLAIAQLALNKNDYQEAVNSLKQAEKLTPNDPKVHYLMARAWAPSDNQKATTYLAKALELNPRHPESLLLQCEELLDGEQFELADEVIEQVLAINPKHPKAGPCGQSSSISKASIAKRASAALAL